MPKYQEPFCVCRCWCFVCLCVCLCKREREGTLCAVKDFSSKTEVWNSLTNANGLRHLPTNQVPQSLHHPPQLLHQHHTNTPCITRHPITTSRSSTTGAAACGPGTCGADTACLPNSRGDRWGELGSMVGWKYWGNRRERRDVASGAFHTLSLITQTFCHAKGRSTSLTQNKGISSEECEGLNRIVLCVLVAFCM